LDLDNERTRQRPATIESGAAMQRLEGKVAFITGGARGQGAAIARKFAAEGADIILCDICEDISTLGYALASTSDLEATAAEVHELGRRCHAEVADVRSQEALDRVVRNGIAELGSLDIVVANAGIVGYGAFWEMRDEEWSDQIDVNLTGAWRTLRAVTPRMRERRAGSIVFTISSSGVEGLWDYMPYVAAKHGLMGVMKCAALELGSYNIRVNAVMPGPVDTKMNDHPAGRDFMVGRAGATREEYLRAIVGWHVLGSTTALPAEAIADAMIWIVSDEARYVTGLELLVDAGHHLLPGTNPKQVIDDDVITERAAHPSGHNGR
jgi:SDR family mycofactocin-dependent oxidoreductase